MNDPAPHLSKEALNEQHERGPAAEIPVSPPRLFLKVRH